MERECRTICGTSGNQQYRLTRLRASSDVIDNDEGSVSIVRNRSDKYQERRVRTELDKRLTVLLILPIMANALALFAINHRDALATSNYRALR